MDEAITQGLEALSGLDAALGLRHLRGRLDSYVRLLKKFADTRAADIDNMGNQLAARDYAELASLAHNIKGIGGFLGATEIHGLAGEVSAAVRGGRDEAEIARLAAALIEAQSELRAGVFALVAQLRRSNA